MLIEFSVTNFLSFREKQTLSMVASSRDDSLEDNLIVLSLPGLSDVKLLKTAVLCGPNASGKSNLLKALRFMDRFVVNSAARLKPGESTNVKSFRLDKSSAGKPSEFEIIFIADGVRYQYGFALDGERVHSEWLYAYPEGRGQRWFQRKFDNDRNDYSWEFSQKYFRGEKELLRSKTRENALFLSTAVQFNHKQLDAVYRWFSQKLHHLDLGTSVESNMSETVLLMDKRQELRPRISEMLSHADLGVNRVDVEVEEFNAEMLPDGIPPKMREEIAENMKGGKRLSLNWFHKRPNTTEEISFDSESQSAGTLRYFSALGPWLQAIDSGHVLTVDELGANIHPLLVRAMLKMMHNPKENTSNAQVIFATHDVTLLDKEIFRRDQIWFTEKDKNLASQLYPLSDFQPRKDEALAKGYLAGRYGAIPFLTGELAL